MPRATLSSGSIPGAFPPQPWPEFDVTCVDGGTLWNNNFMSAIQRCREIVDNDSDIIVDMVGLLKLASIHGSVHVSARAIAAGSDVVSMKSTYLVRSENWLNN